MKISRLVLVVGFLVMMPCAAGAQRTSAGSSFVGLRVGSGFTGFGGGLEYGMYTLSGFWRVDASEMTHRCVLVDAADRELDKEDYMHLVVEGSYMYKIVSTHNRSMSLYGGGGAFLGLELADPFNRKPNGGNSPLSRTRFLYGVSVGLEAEFFVVRNFALFVDGRLPVNFSSQVSKVHGEMYFGAKFNF